MACYIIGLVLGIVVFILQNLKPTSFWFRILFLILTVAFLWGISYAHLGFWNIFLMPIGVSFLCFISAFCFPYSSSDARKEYMAVNGRNYFVELKNEDCIGRTSPSSNHEYNEEDKMKDHVSLELSNEIGICSAGIGSILENDYKIPKEELDNAILENYGLILAYAYIKNSLSLEEIGECLSCFIGVNIGNDKEKFMFASKALQFYIKHLNRIEQNAEDFITESIIIYNLCRPGTWNDFGNNIPIKDTDFFQTTELWNKVKYFIDNVVPERINPILEKID